MSEPDMSRIVEDNFDKAATVYDATPIFRLFGPRLVELAGLRPGDRVLDVATGTGVDLLLAAERIGSDGQVVGIDVSATMVENATRVIQTRGITNAEARQMDATALDFADGSFDAALCGFSLWYIPELDEALAEVKRVLRPDGRFAVSTWGPPPELYRRYNELFRLHGGTAPNLSSHDMTKPDAVSSVLTIAGFEVLLSTAEEQTFTYRDEQLWWDQRPANQQVNDASLTTDDLLHFKAAAFEMVQAFRGPDGIREERIANFALAQKAL